MSQTDLPVISAARLIIKETLTQAAPCFYCGCQSFERTLGEPIPDWLRRQLHPENPLLQPLTWRCVCCGSARAA